MKYVNPENVFSNLKGLQVNPNAYKSTEENVYLVTPPKGDSKKKQPKCKYTNR